MQNVFPADPTRAIVGAVDGQGLPLSTTGTTPASGSNVSASGVQTPPLHSPMV